MLNIERDQWRTIPELMTLMNLFFVVNEITQSVSQANVSHESVLLVNQKHVARAVKSDSWADDSYEPVPCSESDHTEWVSSEWLSRVSSFSESKTCSTSSEVWFLS